MSKITELRREATEAVRARRFDAATKLYERICGLDGSNPGYRNELGDLFIKMGNVPSGVENFLKAIELYMAVGLTNNAVAVHKKILRFDPERADSQWGLGEIRRRQNLETEASASFLEFLDRADNVTDRDRDVFLDRCALLIENMPEDLQILSKLEEIYHKWGLSEERARVLICKAKLAVSSGESDVAEHYIARARELSARLDQIPEYADLPSDAQSHGARAGGHEPAGAAPVEAPRSAPPPAGKAGGAAIRLGASPAANGAPPAAAPAPPEPQPTAAEPAASAADGADEFVRFPMRPASAKGATRAVPKAPVSSTPAASGSAATPSKARGGFNLLDAILADGDGPVDLDSADQRQVQSIVENLQGQMGSGVSAQDHKGQYDLGLVYIDMALYEQAIQALGLAAMGEDVRLKALEMKGVSLRRMGRLEEALDTYREGLAVAGHPARHYLGLLYEVGGCLEELGELEEALDHYNRVVALDAEFLDIQERLARLQAAR